jgi:hypothetical protein
MKDTTFSIRIASGDLDTIKQKAKQARLSQSDYVTRCCLGRQVVVVEDLKEVLKQQRAIGNNLNQLTMLANMGRVSVANLGRNGAGAGGHQRDAAGDRRAREVDEIAIISFTNYPKGQNRPAWRRSWRTRSGRQKTLWQGQSLVSGINCTPESVYDDFLSTKLLYHKDDKTLFFHMVQSFPRAPTSIRSRRTRRQWSLAKYFEGREVLVCTHTDRGHVHSHFIINSVSLEDGKKLHISEPEQIELHQRNDQVCEMFGPAGISERPEKEKSEIHVHGGVHIAAKGESWKFRLMDTIDECMRYAGTREEFITLMRTEGYDVRWEDSGKNITYTTRPA